MVRVKTEVWEVAHHPAGAGWRRLGPGAPRSALGRGVRARGAREAASLPRSGASRGI